LVFYFPDATSGGFDRLQGTRFTDDGPAAQVFNQPGCGGGGCIQRTNDPATPVRAFSRLWDTAVAPDGCLLVSDEGDGSIYVIDTRVATDANPLVSIVATGLANPRGLAFDLSGNLLVAVQGDDAIVRIGPSPSTTDCF
jgi:DNA-binding beta-propeller fold protein YncE